MRTRSAVLGWRLGLGWLIGRKVIILTTQDRAGAIRRTVLPYRFYAGNLYAADDGAGWVSDLAAVPRATVQAHPGPLAVRRRRPTPDEVAVLGDDGVWVVLEPTGEAVPPPVEPDLVWLWALAVPAILLALWWRRRLTP